MKVEIYSDVACPWCYIGKARFDRALRAFAGGASVEVAFRPYQLDPAAPERAVPMLEHLERRFGGNARSMTRRVAEVARAEELVMDFENGLAANTLHAHRLLRLAEREYGAVVQRAVADGLFRAHFALGLDIGDSEVLVGVAREAGVPEERTRAYLASDEGATEVRGEIDRAQQLGITAVPTFVFAGKYAIQGAQPISAFLQALETVAAEEAAVSDGAGVACAPGVCGI